VIRGCAYGVIGVGLAVQCRCTSGMDEREESTERIIVSSGSCAIRTRDLRGLIPSVEYTGNSNGPHGYASEVANPIIDIVNRF
jgi:hypothetical protein